MGISSKTVFVCGMWKDLLSSSWESLISRAKEPLESGSKLAEEKCNRKGSSFFDNLS